MLSKLTNYTYYYLCKITIFTIMYYRLSEKYCKIKISGNFVIYITYIMQCYLLL